MKIKNLSKSIFTLSIVSIVVLCMSFGQDKKSAYGNKIMLYGMAYNKYCNTETYSYYTYKLIDAEDYYSEKEDLESYLEENYSNSTRIRVSSSKYDFGESASNMCIIKWTKNNNNCSYDVVYIAFGTSQQDAQNRAVNQKNSFGGNDVSYSFLEQKYW